MREPYPGEVFVVAVVIAALAFCAIELFGTGQSDAASRRQAIAECEQHGGLAVVIAGELSSRGIGCAQPLGR